MQDADISDPDDDIEPPSPKHPRLEVPSDSLVMDTANFDKKHDTADHEKYQFSTHHFTPDMYKFAKKYWWPKLSAPVAHAISMAEIQQAERWLLPSLHDVL